MNGMCITPDDRNVGTNAIEKILRNCVVFENWVNVLEREGRSFFSTTP